MRTARHCGATRRFQVPIERRHAVSGISIKTVRRSGVLPAIDAKSRRCANRLRFDNGFSVAAASWRICSDLSAARPTFDSPERIDVLVGVGRDALKSAAKTADWRRVLGTNAKRRRNSRQADEVLDGAMRGASILDSPGRVQKLRQSVIALSCMNAKKQHYRAYSELRALALGDMKRIG